MTKKDFFILIIKLFGLYSIVISLFSVLPNNISYALVNINLFSIFWILIVLIVVLGLFVLLIFKADKIVDKLKLEKGFDTDNIEFGNLDSSDIIKIGTFIIGGILLIKNIPSFLSHTYYALKSDVIGKEYTTEDNFYWIVSGLNIFIGYILIKYFDLVSKLFINKKIKT